MFKEVDPNQENVIVAAERKSRGVDYSIRTVTHWFTLPQHFGSCTVSTHEQNIPDADMQGNSYYKERNRLVVDIGDQKVCRWCYIAGADLDGSSD